MNPQSGSGVGGTETGGGPRWRRHLPAALLLGLFWLALTLPVLATGQRLGIWDWDHVLAFAQVERQAVAEAGELPLWNPYVAGGTVLLQHPLSQALSPGFALVLALGVPLGLKVLLALRLALGLAGGYLLGLRLSTPSHKYGDVARGSGAPLARRADAGAAEPSSRRRNATSGDGWAADTLPYSWDGVPRMSRSGAVLAAVVMSGSGAWAAHLGFGHFPWTLAAYLPWAMLALHEACSGGRWRWAWVGGAAVGVALLYLGGGPYLLFGFAFFAAAWLATRAVLARSARPLLVGVAAFALAGVLSGAKLLPSVGLMRQHARVTPAMTPLRFGEPVAGWREVPLALQRIFLARSELEELDPLLLNHFAFWTAYRRGEVTRGQAAQRNRIVEEVNFHAYLGVLPLALAAVALVGGGRRKMLRQALPYLVGLLLLLLLILSDAFARVWGLSPWEALRRLPVLGSLRTAGRFLIVAALPLGVLAGLGLTRVEAWLAARSATAGSRAPAWRLLKRWLGPLLAAVVAADLALNAFGFLVRAFPYPPVHPPERPFVTLLAPVGGSDLATVRSRVGALGAHDNLKLPTGATARGTPGYRGEAFLDAGHGRAELLEIRPNRVVVRVEAQAPDLLVINQTYLDGWHRVDAPLMDAPHEVRSQGRRLATAVEPEDREITLRYRPRTLNAGVALSATGLLILAGLITAPLRRQPSP